VAARTRQGRADATAAAEGPRLGLLARPPVDAVRNHLDRGELFTDYDDYSVPTGPAVAIDVAGGRGWKFELAPPAHKPHPLRVAVDDVTGLLVRMGVRETGAYTEMVEFHVDVSVPDDRRTRISAWFNAADRSSLSCRRAPGPRLQGWSHERRGARRCVLPQLRRAAASRVRPLDPRANTWTSGMPTP